MAFVNNLKEDFKRLKKNYGLTAKEIGKMTGYSKETMRGMLESGTVTKSFVEVMERLGYDIRILYIPRLDSEIRRERQARGYFTDEERMLTINTGEPTRKKSPKGEGD